MAKGKTRKEGALPPTGAGLDKILWWGNKRN